MKADNSPARTLYLTENLWVPPDMEGIDDDTSCRAGKLIDNVRCLLQSDDDRPFGSIHRMQWFNAKNDARSLSVRYHLQQAIKYSGPRVIQSLSISRTGDNYQYRCAEQRSLFNSNAIICNPFPTFLDGWCGEPPSAT